jgi:hypothetical protein
MAHVTFIHGIANKPAPDVLIKMWRQALAHDDGLALGTKGITSTMVYWADVMYDKPAEGEAAQENLDGTVDRALTPPVPMEWQKELSGTEKKWVDAFAGKLKIAEPDPQAAERPGRAEAGHLERVPLPWWIKRHVMEIFLRDVHHYLFNVKYSPRPGARYRVQDEIRNRLVTALKEGAKKPGPHVLMSHSMGTVIAYDCLKRVPDCPKVDALMTIGSPLGLDEIQDKMKPEWSRQNGFPSERLGSTWVNVYDALDPVAGFDPNITNDYMRSATPAVEDIHEPNYGPWRHDITKYLSGTKLRASLKKMLKL